MRNRAVFDFLFFSFTGTWYIRCFMTAYKLYISCLFGRRKIILHLLPTKYYFRNKTHAVLIYTVGSLNRFIKLMIFSAEMTLFMYIFFINLVSIAGIQYYFGLFS